LECSGPRQARRTAGHCESKAKGGMENGTRTSWSGCLFLVQTVVQTRVARGLQHRSRWYDATRGRRGWRGSDDSRLVCLTCCLLVARATFRVAAGRGKGSSGSSSRGEVGALQEAERGIPQPRRTTARNRPSDAMRRDGAGRAAVVRWTRGRTGSEWRTAGGGSGATTGRDREALANRHEGSLAR
jgi:hypothetical protein